MSSDAIQSRNEPTEANRERNADGNVLTGVATLRRLRPPATHTVTDGDTSICSYISQKLHYFIYYRK